MAESKVASDLESSKSALLVVYDEEERTANNDAKVWNPLPNSNTCKVSQKALLAYQIIEPFTRVIVLTQDLNQAEAKHICSLICPGGEIRVEKQDQAKRSVSELKMLLLTAGFSKLRTQEDGSIEGTKAVTNIQVIPVAQLDMKPGNSWKELGTMGSSELISDEELVQPSDYIKPNPTIDCGPTAAGPKKACKNCSCGLAELQATQDGEPVMGAEKPKSSCGSCYLGDAFRCSGCPYRGLPAFEAGQQVQLPNTFMQDDI